RVVLSADGNLLAEIGSNGSVVLWDVRTGRKGDAFQAAGKMVPAFAFAPDGKSWAAVYTTLGGAAAGIVPGTATGKELSRFQPDGYSFALPPDLRLLAAAYTVDEDKKPVHVLVLWDLATGKRIRGVSRRLGEGATHHLSVFSADSRVLVSMTDGGTH